MTVFADADFFALLSVLYRTVRAATSRAVVTMLGSHKQTIEFAVAELAVGLVLLGPHLVIAKLNGSDQGRIHRVHVCLGERRSGRLNDHLASGGQSRFDTLSPC